MLQVMDYIEASCVIDVEVGTLNRFEHSKISVLTVTELGIGMTVQVKSRGCYETNPNRPPFHRRMNCLYQKKTRDFGGNSPGCIQSV